MASILKRKRGPVDVLDTPKRTRQDSEPMPPATKFTQSNVGWDIFASLERGKELVQADQTADKGTNDDAEAIDFEDFFAPPSREPSHEPQNKEPKRTPIRPKSNKKLWERPIPQAPKPRVPGWMISNSVGGRVINAEPVFAKDEKYANSAGFQRSMLIGLKIVHFGSPDELARLLNFQFASYKNY